MCQLIIYFQADLAVIAAEVAGYLASRLAEDKNCVPRKSSQPRTLHVAVTESIQEINQSQLTFSI